MSPRGENALPIAPLIACPSGQARVLHFARGLSSALQCVDKHQGPIGRRSLDCLQGGNCRAIMEPASHATSREMSDTPCARHAPPPPKTRAYSGWPGCFSGHPGGIPHPRAHRPALPRQPAAAGRCRSGAAEPADPAPAPNPQAGSPPALPSCSRPSATRMPAGTLAVGTVQKTGTLADRAVFAVGVQARPRFRCWWVRRRCGTGRRSRQPQPHRAKESCHLSYYKYNLSPYACWRSGLTLFPVVFERLQCFAARTFRL